VCVQARNRGRVTGEAVAAGGATVAAGAGEALVALLEAACAAAGRVAVGAGEASASGTVLSVAVEVVEADGGGGDDGVAAAESALEDVGFVGGRVAPGGDVVDEMIGTIEVDVVGFGDGGVAARVVELSLEASATGLGAGAALLAGIICLGIVWWLAGRAADVLVELWARASSGKQRQERRPAHRPRTRSPLQRARLPGLRPSPTRCIHRRSGLAARKLDSIFNALGTKGP